MDRDLDNQDTDEETEWVTLDNGKKHGMDQPSEKEQQLELQKYLERDHKEFPDEIDTPLDIPASIRFQKYRGMKSFKNSPWDPYENLPPDYSRIFQFQNYSSSKKSAMASVQGGMPVGTRIRIELKNVPETIQEYKDKVLTLYGLLLHEQKMSIMNFTMTKRKEYKEPIQSKQRVLLMVGARRYLVNPIYSAHTRGGPNQVFKMERFVQEKTVVGTCFAPIQFGTAPVFVFQYDPTRLKGILY
jgi:pre-rRNA-processing protein TSR1